MKQSPLQHSELGKSMDKKHFEELLCVKDNYITELEKQLTELRGQLEQSMTKEMQAKQKLITTVHQYNSEKKGKACVKY